MSTQEMVVGSGPPAGCRCRWIPRTQNWGGDTKVAWVLWEIDPGCHLHGMVSPDKPLDTDS